LEGMTMQRAVAEATKKTKTSTFSDVDVDVDANGDHADNITQVAAPVQQHTQSTTYKL
jgi:hypothetical protein